MTTPSQSEDTITPKSCTCSTTTTPEQPCSNSMAALTVDPSRRKAVLESLAAQAEQQRKAYAGKSLMTAGKALLAFLAGGASLVVATNYDDALIAVLGWTVGIAFMLYAGRTIRDAELMAIYSEVLADQGKALRDA
jgi:hypothetical protein